MKICTNANVHDEEKNISKRDLIKMTVANSEPDVPSDKNDRYWAKLSAEGPSLLGDFTGERCSTGLQGYSNEKEMADLGNCMRAGEGDVASR